jgi:hypothetical protein
MKVKPLKIKIKEPTPSAADRLYAQQQKNRKAAGLPDPSEYKKKLDMMKSENYEEDDGPLSQEQLDELSPATKSSYVTKAKDQIKQSMPFTKKSDEYRDIAKNFIAKRQKGIAKANESVTVGRVAGRGNIYQYDRNPGPRDDESDHVPYVPKTDKDKKLAAALTDVGKTFPKSITARPKYPKLKEAKDSQEYDYEGDMAKSDLRSIMHHAKELHDMIDDTTNLAEWCQSKITLSEDYLSTVANYMRSEMNEETIEEDKNDYQRKIEKNNKNFIAASKRQKNPLTNVHTAQTKQKPVKEEVEQLDEKKKLPGLWANIHAKRKRGESPAKPGDEDYPKTLKIEDADPCWKDYKMVGMKNKNGRKVPNCVPKENVSTMKKEGAQDDLKADQITTDDQKFPKKMSRKAEIVKKLAKGKEEQFQANPVLDSDVNPQTNKQ